MTLTVVDVDVCPYVRPLPEDAGPSASEERRSEVCDLVQVAPRDPGVEQGAVGEAVDDAWGNDVGACVALGIGRDGEEVHGVVDGGRGDGVDGRDVEV